MRKALIGFLLAATAAVPAAANAAPNHERDRGERSERSEQHSSRQAPRSEARAPRAAPATQPQVRAPAQAGASGQRQQAVAQSRRDDRGGSDRRGAYRQRVQETRAASQASAAGLSPHYQQKAAENQARYEQKLREQVRDQRHDRNDWRDNRGNDRGDWRDNRGNDRNDWRNNRNDRGSWNGNRNGSSEWRGNRNGGHANWNRGWRQDNRYDWQRYRSSNRGIFHRQPYYAPYRGYRYSRFSIGLFLNSGFYARNYWISDPWMYRLPSAPPGTQWVRYYNDVLLVDVYNGQVVDAIYDFFW